MFCNNTIINLQGTAVTIRLIVVSVSAQLCHDRALSEESIDLAGLDLRCPPLGLSASNALQITIQP